MLNKTYDGTLTTDGRIVLDNVELPVEDVRVLVTVLGPKPAVIDTKPMETFESYLRTMPDVGVDEDFSRIAGTFRDVDLAD